jgi:acetolactate synthase-1/2/3 large subunit
MQQRMQRRTSQLEQALNNGDRLFPLEQTGGEIVIEALIRHGVEHVFGIPGGANLPIYDALPQYEKAGLIKHFLMGHEQGAVHAAEGYARATGKLGVCSATSGPGATNLVTGLQDAKSDSTPILAITGQVASHLIGTDAFQEADITGITRPCTKHNFLVRNIEELTFVLQEAMYIAETGRLGPVLVDLPKDISSKKTIPRWRNIEEIRKSLRGYNPYPEPKLDSLEKAFNFIKCSERPVLYVGGGVIAANASEALYKFATRMQIPVVSTFKALDSFPANHELALRAPGMHGSVAANYALNNADCVIALGARFDDRVTGKLSEFAQRAKVIHIDIDDSEIDKIKRTDVAIQNDIGIALYYLQKFAEMFSNQDRYAHWREQVRKWKDDWPLTYKKNIEEKIMPQFVIESLYEITKNQDVIIATGVGQHQMWVTQFYCFTKPRTFISSLGLATMGYGLPAAIGAQVACPNKLVIDVDGDGSFLMTQQELVVLGREQLPVKVLVIANRHLGMVKQWQTSYYNKNYSAVDIAYDRYPDFSKIAEGFGILGKRISKSREVVPAIEEMLSHSKPYVLHVDVDPDAEVYPMIGPGKSWKEIVYPFKPLPSIPEY